MNAAVSVREPDMLQAYGSITYRPAPPTRWSSRRTFGFVVGSSIALWATAIYASLLLA
jgi:hypothetical protein